MEPDKDLMRNTMIAAPCSEKWEDMTGDDRARLCAKCDLHVVNTFMLTDEEVLASLEKIHKGERICMRIYRRQDGTFMTRNCPVGVQRIREKAFKAAVWMASGLSVLLSLAANALPASSGKPGNSNKKKPVWHSKVSQNECDGTHTKPKPRAGVPKISAPEFMIPTAGLPAPYLPPLPQTKEVSKGPEMIVPSKPATVGGTTGDADTSTTASDSSSSSEIKPQENITPDERLKSKGVVQVKPSSSGIGTGGTDQSK